MSFSQILRRSHLYLALFLMPWVLLYALSTAVMNHKARPGMPPVWELVEKRAYNGVFAEGASHQEIGQQLLLSFDMDGAHRASRQKDGSVVVQRALATGPVRLTYQPASREVTIEKQVVNGTIVLEQMHRRRGYQAPYLIDDIWAACVDLFIVGVLFWTLSGLWLWWELKVTRVIGGVVLASGVGIFTYFLAVL